MPTIKRAKTAIRRVEYSRPVKVVLAEGILNPNRTFFDFGCGHGDDIARLTSDGIQTMGWDPANHPDGKQTPADIVNIGYVINVIEDPNERRQALRDAWALAQSVLVVAARMTFEHRPTNVKSDLGDGCVTSWNTFQKFYGQNELREWINETLGCQAVAAAPGVMFVFRNDGERQDFLISRSRSFGARPRLRQCDALFEENQELVRWLCDFFEERGRLPIETDCPNIEAINSAFGSVRKAYQVIRRVIGGEQLDLAAEARRQDLLIYLALERFGQRPRMGELNPHLQRDVRALFGSFKSACTEADALLFTAGDLNEVSRAMDRVPIGKVTQSALYVHVTALPLLPPILRVYEGCARRYYGMVEEANIIKLNRLKPKVSFLEYPDFDSVAHPTLHGAHVISLGSFKVKYYNNRESDNPPILHRKETFVAPGYPARDRFERLTAQEEKHGLLDNSFQNGRLLEWNSMLDAKGLRVQGHRLLRQKDSN